MPGSLPSGQALIQVDKITIATAELDAMRVFYQVLIGADFRPMDMGGIEFFIAHAGVEIWLIPRSAAGVIARDNVVQLRLVVKSVYELLPRLEAAGGVILGEPQSFQGICLGAIRDPDGNVIELKSSIG